MPFFSGLRSRFSFLRVPTPTNGCLGLAFLLLPFSNGRDTLAIAAWLVPIGLIRYLRDTQNPFARSIVGLGLLLGWLFQFRGMVPLPLGGRIGIGFAYALVGLTPYVLDQWLTKKVRGFASTVIFPCAVVSMEFALSSFSPYASFGAVAYSQFGNLPLLQVLSVTGLYGVSFLVSWLGPVIIWAWTESFSWSTTRSGGIFYGLVMAGLLLAGRLRLAEFPPRSSDQRVAALAPEEYRLFPSPSVAQRFFNHQSITADELQFIKAATTQLNNRLFAQSEIEANAGARLIVWSEGAAQVLKADEPALIAKGAEFARNHHLYLGLGLLSFDSSSPKTNQNKVVLLGPKGTVLFEYWKARLLPGSEAAMTQANGNGMPYADTPLGRVGALICFDLNFPSLVRAAGRAHTDLVFAPSSDWLALDPWHSQMATFRAIENGFNLVRGVNHGRSLAVNYLGQTVAESDYFSHSDHVMVAFVPTKGLHTLYAQIGDVFAWLCAGGLLGFALYALTTAS